MHERDVAANLPKPEERVRNLVYTCPVDHVGTSVFVKGWLIPGPAKEALILVHDLGETAENLAACAKKIALRGYSVYCFDLRGHGQSGRRLGHVANFNQLALDLLQVVAWVKHKGGGKKPLVIGQGMGALVALFFAKSYGKFCKAMVLSSPLLALSENITPFKRLLLKTLADLFPTMMTPQWLCPVFTVADKEKSKAKALPKVTTHLAFELLTAISRARKIFYRHNVPTLLIGAKDDPICKAEMLKRLVHKQRFHESLELVFVDASTHHLLSSEGEALDNTIECLDQWISSLSRETLGDCEDVTPVAM